jgi:triphosphatase
MTRVYRLEGGGDGQAMTGEVMEIELKFHLPQDAAEQVLQHPMLQGDERTAHVRSVYFDTPDHALRRGGLGLRLRDTGDGFVQTVKQDDGSGGIARGEWETATLKEALDPEALAKTPAGEILGGRFGGLQPVFSTIVERRTRMRLQDGARIEVSFDSGEVSSGERQEPISEVELELKEGEPAALFDLGRTLVRETPLRLSFESKAERGHRLCDETVLEPRTAGAVTLEPGISAAGAFRRIALGCLAQAVGNAELLAAVRRPEGVHQMRVGLRRLRAAIKAFEPMLGDNQRDGVEAELKWLATELDAARDLDVFIHGVFRPAARETDDSALAALGRQLVEAQTRAYDRAQNAVNSDRYGVLTLETAAWIEVGDWSRSPDPVSSALRAQPAAIFAAGALDRLRKVVRRRGSRFEKLDPVSRHKLRIRAKRLRYATEFFAPLFPDGGKKKRKFIKTLKDMQDCLGALNDIRVARDRVLGQGGLDRQELAFVAGRIVGRRESEEPRLLEQAEEAVAAFRDADPFWD